MRAPTRIAIAVSMALPIALMGSPATGSAGTPTPPAATPRPKPTSPGRTPEPVSSGTAVFRGSDQPATLPSDPAAPESAMTDVPAAGIATALETAEYLVAFDKPGKAADHRKTLAAVGRDLADSLRPVSARIGVVTMGKSDSTRLAALRGARGIAHVAANSHFDVAATPNDPQFQNRSQWWAWSRLEYSGAATFAGAWGTTTGSSNVTVAVVDTGAVLDHPDMFGKWSNGYDFVDGDANPTDPGLTPGDTAVSEWHGTWVASIIGALTNNGSGLAGASWNAKVQPVRVLTGDGGTEEDVISGILWSAGIPVTGAPTNSDPADVINLSLNAPDIACDPVIQLALDDATAAGATVVVAAGNDGVDAATSTPAGCDNIVTVAAHDQNGNQASFSNYGSVVDVSAPGVDIPGAVCTGTEVCGSRDYATGDGTSFAAPLVSGAIALALAVAPDMDTDAVLNALSNTGPPPYCGYNSPCGGTMLDAGDLIDRMLNGMLFAEFAAGVTLPLTDGFRDTATAQVTSPDPDNVDFRLFDALHSTQLAAWGSTATTSTDGVYRASITVGDGSHSISALAPGTYAILATQSTSGGTWTQWLPLTVGTGQALSLSVVLSTDTVMPMVDGYLDTGTAELYATDETGTRLPFTGSVTLAGGTTSFTADARPHLTFGAGLAFGTYTLAATGRGPNGATQSASATVTSVSTGIASLAIGLSTGTVYPVRDGFADSVAISVAAPSNTNYDMGASGTITLKKGKKTIKSWRMSHTGTTTVTWNGKVKGKIKTGSYRVVVSVRAGQQGARGAVRTVAVSKKKVVWRTAKGPWFTAYSALDSCYGSGDWACEYDTDGMVRYYAGMYVGDTVAAMHSLPFPVSASRVSSWRLWTSGWTTDARYTSIICATSDLGTCDAYDAASQGYPTGHYADGVWYTNWTSTGIANGYPVWLMFNSVDWGSIYVYGYMIEARYWTLK